VSDRSGFGQPKSFHANDPGLVRFNPLQQGFAGSTVHFRDSCQRHAIRDYNSDATA